MTRAVLVAAALLPLAAPALAQTGLSPAVVPEPRFEVSVGAGVFGGGAAGRRDATLRANELVPRAYTIFGTSTRVTSSSLGEVRMNVRVMRRVHVEARVGYSRPELRTSLSGDVEGAPALTVVERVDQYLFDGGILFMLEEARVAGFVPFAAAGAGYVRHLHEGRTLVEEGHSYHLGGGVKRRLLFRRRGLLRSLGFRVDARLNLIAGGMAFTNRPTPHGAVSGGLFAGF